METLEFKNGWLNLKDDQVEAIEHFCDKYKHFLDIGKTERQCVKESIKQAEQHGFRPINEFAELKAGDKVYFINRNKNVVLTVVGQRPISEGIRYVVSHIDSPRLDIKPNPIHEKSELALMRTHYYGGIKKYQWASRPLALHGVVVTKSGRTIELAIGEDPQDPVFTIPDLLPHLDRKVQRERNAAEVLKGEELQIIIGSIPMEFDDDKIKNKVKHHILTKLHEKYDFTEADFISAELMLVPAGKARDVGIDQGIVGAYGQDDRICAYTSLEAILDIDTPEQTAVCFLVDKEEIGSTGSTGLESRYLEFFTGELLLRQAGANYNDQLLRRCLWNSYALSSDVNAGLNPLFESVHDAQNASKLGYGLVLTKYTGHGGKVASNDADAEYVASLRRIFDEHEISWQTGLLGKVDEGGGGTVAKYLAHYGINTIDAGAAILSMHSPFELASKFDIYELYRAYKAFYAKAL
ncbi:aminopeptidase [Photobacterium jeanii]|uniref:M18 family aminopeptidase n=1 Tax=Photobacterium jeanii TaxID=858640 RepID=A0A178K779_9GAMM|nr:aminopeptidase [Photobacterium jeanii]OAN13199.1 aminopeptidase [Photobacterium jeanii]PST89349.1 aminopeptidase [Photobacterium jeanii]